MGKVISLLGSHPVYQAPKTVLLRIAEKIGFGVMDIAPGEYTTRRLFLSKTKILWYMPLELSRENIYLANSPLIALECWKILTSGVPAVFCEEYTPRGVIKDSAASLGLRAFSGMPFISQTKAGAAFLRGLGLECFFVPPADEKKCGSKKRDLILFVGRAEASKNPLLFLRLAEKMKEEQFVFIGRGRMESEIAERAKSIPNLEYIPFLEKREELFSYYSRAKALIHPPLSDPIGFVVTEALSASTPVLASARVGAASFLPEKWVVRGFGEEEWEGRLREVIGDGSESIALAKEVFKKEHLDIEDPYFSEISARLEKGMMRRWPRLFG